MEGGSVHSVYIYSDGYSIQVWREVVFTVYMGWLLCTSKCVDCFEAIIT